MNSISLYLSASLNLISQKAYLRSARQHLTADIERARRIGVCFAGKLVRGAYLVGERKRAADLGIESPICATLEETHASYNACIELVLRQRASHDAAHLVSSTNERESAAMNNLLFCCNKKTNVSLRVLCLLVFFFVVCRL